MAIIPSLVNFLLSVGPAITGGGSHNHVGLGPTYYPPLDYKPKPTGIPFTLKNDTAVAEPQNSHIPVTTTSVNSILDSTLAPEQSTSTSSYILPSVGDSSFATNTPTSTSSVTVPMPQTTDSSIASAVYSSTSSSAVAVSTQQLSSTSTSTNTSGSETPEQPTSSSTAPVYQTPSATAASEQPEATSTPSAYTTPTPTAVPEQQTANSTSEDIHATLDSNESTGQQVNNNTQTGQNWGSCGAGGAAGYWYANIEHNGQSSFLESGSKENYTVFRNVVTDFNADNTGQKDASGAIQNAIQGMVDLPLVQGVF
ncbi:uncharacterized protein LDX57_004371 [Aspergillus melleus]|uniref:uncharacterized protein n=1 Tax=Aspergillus melleus TaxID=138277 RepID=UPI001E8E48B4|nr:uncharacterized protein LDX57_004371 [Aspergillus melleus]KAH8426638.1 hypothetical protein LDX57_004371 [Aspergillus melleus]